MAGPSSWENMMRRKSAQQRRFFGGIGDLLSKPFRPAYVKSLEAASQVEPTIGPRVGAQREFFEALIRQQTEEDRRSGESGAPYPDEGVSPEEILMQQALQQGDASPESDMGLYDPELMRQILGEDSLGGLRGGMDSIPRGR